MYYGLDLHKRFIQVSKVSQKGKEVSNWKVLTNPKSIEEFASSLNSQDQVVMEATFNTWSIYNLIKKGKCGKVVVANPIQVKAISSAKVKTDKVDAHILAQLLRLDFIPEVTVPRHDTWELRQMVAHRKGLVKRRVASINSLKSVLNHKLLDFPRDLFGPTGKGWIAQQNFTKVEKLMVENSLELIHEINKKIKRLDQQLTKDAQTKEEVRLLMTIPGVGLTVAMGIYSAIEDISRFDSPDKLASYFGLTPRIHQSADKCYFGRISKAGSSIGRWLAIEAAQQMAITSGAPLTATYFRVRKKKGHNVAITALARKLIILCWHMLKNNEPYRYAPLKRSTKEKLRKVTKGYRQPYGKGSAPKTIEELYKEVKLPPIQSLTEAELRVRKINKRTVSLGRSHFKFNKIDTRNRHQKTMS